MVLSCVLSVDKYLMIVLIMMIAGMGISAMRDPPTWGIFYVMLAGAIVVIMYSSLQTRKKVQEERKRKRRFGK